MKKSSRKSQGIHSKQLQPRPIDTPALGQATGGDEPAPPPPPWVSGQHNETLVRDRSGRRSRARR